MTKEEFCKALSLVVKEDYDAVLVEKEHQFSPQFEKKILGLNREGGNPSLSSASADYSPYQLMQENSSSGC